MLPSLRPVGVRRGLESISGETLTTGKSGCSQGLVGLGWLYLNCLGDL